MASKSEIDREEKGQKKRRNEAPNNGLHESSSKKKKENLKIIKNQEDSSTDDEESLPQEGKVWCVFVVASSQFAFFWLLAIAFFFQVFSSF